MTTSTGTPLLSRSEWERRLQQHLLRAERHTAPARQHRARAEPHPITDFLFQYYPFPFSLLEQWHPGLGIALEWPAADQAASPTPGLPPPASWFSEKHYRRCDGWIEADPGLLSAKQRERFRWNLHLLEAMQGRTPNFSCHGLHEWAMVYRGREIRHAHTAGLRLPQEEIDAVVEARSLVCSHHDAFRFFAGEARPLNRLQPGLETREQLEQPGCVHANMDLYKWTAKAMPWAGSDLLLDTFELALELRDLDMRASPYDLSAWGRPPIRIETPEGRREYEREQRRLAEAAVPLRTRLISVLAALTR